MISHPTYGKGGPAVRIDPDFRSELLTPRDDVVVLALEGAVDIHAAPEFKALFLRTIAQGARQIVIDLTKTTFLDSTGLGVLVSGAKQARKGSLAIVCNDESMAHVFTMVGLDRIFTMFASRAAALASLA
jgi:anti-sigma B factor antagonist